MSPTTRNNEGRTRLGRGLAALLGDTPTEKELGNVGGSVGTSPIELLYPNPDNPRTTFREDELEELAASIKEKGVIQPIIVRPLNDPPNAFQIVAGERRWRAAQRASLHEVPILIIEANDRDALEIAIVENVQRKDLNAIDEARGYHKLEAQYGYNHEDIGRLVGKSRSHITNTVRLLSHSDVVKGMVADGRLTAGHARALLSVSEPDQVAQRIVSNGLSVRDVERLVLNPRKPRKTEAQTAKDGDVDAKALEEKLSLSLGAKVTIQYSGEKGKLTISFTSLDQLEALCDRLVGSGPPHLKDSKSPN